ncbi:zinc ribbon domain-containing protein [Marinicella sp. W31]|uniref:zinc ribbon domain-containing protein n=1 Tax=Marinicella sp. W31 TaxID=3023713 RepID=UPI003757EA4A
MKHRNWQCEKCNHRVFEVDQFRATGGMFAKIFDVQNKHFTTVSCAQCHHTEIYKIKSSQIGNVFDFLVGS